MWSTAKLISSLKLCKTANNGSIHYILTPVPKQPLISTFRLCHGSKETAVAEKESPKTVMSQSDKTEENRILSGSSRKRQLNRWDKAILYLNSEKGRYKSLKDVPDEVPWSTIGVAYDKQRVRIMVVTIPIGLIVCFLFIIWQKTDIDKSEYHGQRLLESSWSIANEMKSDKGAPLPHLTKRNTDDNTEK